MGGFFWPRFRTDEFLNKKWLAAETMDHHRRHHLFDAKDVHRDHIFYMGTSYYFEKPWIVEEASDSTSAIRAPCLRRPVSSQ